MFRGADVPATLRAENEAYIAEATAIAQTQQARAGEVLAMAQSTATYVAEMGSINQQLAATVRAGSTPTVARAVGEAQQVDGTPRSVQFVEVQTASSVRASDSCADVVQTQFTPDTPRIYITARAFNISGGTRMDVEWRHEDQVVWQESWTIPADSGNFCLWFYIDPSMVAFTPGRWTVQLFADGQPAGAAAPFSILEPGQQASG